MVFVTDLTFHSVLELQRYFPFSHSNKVAIFDRDITSLIRKTIVMPIEMAVTSNIMETVFLTTMRKTNIPITITTALYR